MMRDGGKVLQEERKKNVQKGAGAGGGGGRADDLRDIDKKWIWKESIEILQAEMCGGAFGLNAVRQRSIVQTTKVLLLHSVRGVK